MAFIGKDKTPTLPAVLAGKVREVRANTHALPSLPYFTKGMETAA
jgi:hypothetical protein